VTAPAFPGLARTVVGCGDHQQDDRHRSIVFGAIEKTQLITSVP
jgi:hypothetical protein